MINKEETRDEIQKLYFSYTKRPWVYPFIVGLSTLIDISLIVLFYYFTYSDQKRLILIPLLFSHAALSVVLFWVRGRSSPQTKNISPVIFLILPGVGGLVYGVSYISLYRIGERKVQYDIKHAYAEEEIFYKKSVSIDFKQVNKIMDMSGVFTYSNAINKKEVIVDLISSDIVKNCRTLKKGLMDKDAEVVHYTASTLNYLENRFEKAIRDARNKVAEELTKEHLDELIGLYENYIDSGLLDDDIIPIYVRKVVEVLKLELEEFGVDLEVMKNLSRTYLELGQQDEAIAILRKISKMYPKDVDIQFILMQYFYEIGNLTEVRNMANTMKTIDAVLTEEQNNSVNFWAHEEESSGEAAETGTL